MLGPGRATGDLPRTDEHGNLDLDDFLHEERLVAEQVVPLTDTIHLGVERAVDLVVLDDLKAAPVGPEEPGLVLGIGLQFAIEQRGHRIPLELDSCRRRGL